jgi:autotransporter translocation and assembly factor TamB
VTRLRRLRSISAFLARALIGLIVLVLVLLGIVLTVIQTGWAKNRIRDLIVGQANQYLTATLSIGRLDGSLMRGVRLGQVRLAREGRTMIAIEEVSLSYSLRELIQRDLVIQRVRLVQPRIVGAKRPDGRWDLGALIRRETQQEQRRGPQRPIEIQGIEIVDADIVLHDPLNFGAAHVPTHFASLNASASFRYVPVQWQLRFNRLHWVGSAPQLTVTALTGGFGRASIGWFFDHLSVQTPRSAFTLDGRIDTEQKPTFLDLSVHADQFAFQEWSGILRGLRNIAVQASFDTRLKGPTGKLETVLNLKSSGGDIEGRFTLDTTVPGWHGAGAVNVGRLNLARWMNRADRPSHITGRVTFDLALELGRRFPRGVYAFDGSHAMYMDYAADDVRARGWITKNEVQISRADATAYGAKVTTTDGTIGISEPFRFRFRGTAAGLDLRRLPKTIPVPHVESLLALDYDVAGQFARPFIAGSAVFSPSEFLGASIGAGTIGSIDTSQKPLRFSGEGYVENLSLHRFGEGLDVAWLRDPRYAGTVRGRFRVDGSGTDTATLALTGGGRLTQADIFRGTLSDADVSIEIERGTLRASYSGQFAGIDPSVPFADPRLDASLTGNGTVTATVRDLVTAETTTLDDYDISGTVALQNSSARGLRIERGTIEATLRNSSLTITRLDVGGPALEGNASGTVEFTGDNMMNLEYKVSRADLAGLRALTSQDAQGVITADGRVTGPSNALRTIGDASISELNAYNLTALTFTGKFDVTAPATDLARASGRVDASGTFLTIFGQAVRDASGTMTLDADHVGFDLHFVQGEGRNGALSGDFLLRTARDEIELRALTVTFGRAVWRLASSNPPCIVRWTDEEFQVTSMQLAGGAGDEHIDISGNWRHDGAGNLRIAANHVFLETLQGVLERPARYGGVLDADIVVRGTRDVPIVAGTLAISSGRVERVTYEKLVGRVDYSNRVFTIDLRLDQGPGTWITAEGTVPLALFNRSLPEQPMNVAIKSSTINLGLVEGVTGVIREVAGNIQLNVDVIGTSADPHFAGTIDIANASFIVAATGSRYRNTRADVRLSQDRITVESLHVEDSAGRALEVSGSLGTHELSVADVEIDVKAHRFEMLRNQLGRVDVDLNLNIRGRFETPRLIGDVTIGPSEIKVDEILERALFQLYPTAPAPSAEIDPMAALNPWERLGLDVALHVPNTLRLTGTNIQVSPGTPIGLGDINLRVAGDLYLYKDPAQPLYVTGSFDSVSGTYAFQGRPFDVDPTSSIDFRGDLNPEIYVTVKRVINGVETRVSIFGPMQQPELRLASTPPLDPSDILSLIVFGTSANELNSAQQEELVVRAGALAAGFLASPIVSAIESELGLDILEIEPAGDVGTTGPRVTVGEEIAPGLVARFSRQFGQQPYDEATIEYSLSRILRLRATFSDAQSLNARSPFRRIERAGIDLLFFFSF